MSVSQSAVARVTGVDVAFRNFNVGQAFLLDQRLGLIGQGATLSTYALEPYTVLSAGDVGTRFGFGSPLHLAAKQLLPANNDGIKGIPLTIYPLEDDGAGVAADGSIDAVGTSTAAGSGTVRVGGIRSANIAIPSGTAADAALALVKAAIDAVLDMPVVTGTVLAGSLPLDAKWAGESGNDISIDVSGLSAAGITFSTTAFANGANNPDAQDALDMIGEVWETMLFSCLNYNDTTNLDVYSVFGEGRWDALVKKPLVVGHGCTDNFATRTAITDARKSDRTNFLIQSTGSDELPFVVGARGMAKDIIVTANDNPPQNYRGRLTGLAAGLDSVQEGYTVRDQAVKLGASTNIKTGDTAELADIVTFYHPDGEDNPAYRYVVDIVKLQNILYNVRLIFESDDWKGVPLLPAGTPTVNPTAKTPNDAKTALANLADSLELNAIISDADFTKSNLSSEINSTNPKRLDNTFPTKLSGNVEVNSTDIYFGFFLGAA